MYLAILETKYFGEYRDVQGLDVCRKWETPKQKHLNNLQERKTISVKLNKVLFILLRKTCLEFQNCFCLLLLWMMHSLLNLSWTITLKPLWCTLFRKPSHILHSWCLFILFVICFCIFFFKYKARLYQDS